MPDSDPLKPVSKKDHEQRKINFLWELTQSVIAVMITGAVIILAGNGRDYPVLTNAFFLIVSMYFVRTNNNLLTNTMQSK